MIQVSASSNLGLRIVKNIRQLLLEVERKIKILISHFRSSYFRGKKIGDEWDVRVEQAAFEDISLVAHSEGGVLVTIKEGRGGNQRTPR